MKHWQKCVICGAEFIPRNSLSVLCGNPECKKKREGEQKKAYNKRNPVVKVVRKKDSQDNDIIPSVRINILDRIKIIEEEISTLQRALDWFDSRPFYASTTMMRNQIEYIKEYIRKA